MKIILSFLVLSTLALAEIKWPVLNRPVVDEAGWLSVNERQELENWLFIFRQEGKGQVQVVIVSDLHGLPIESYSIQLMDRWKTGDHKRDDGVLFIAAANDRKMRIEVGQGLEGVLTDLQSKRILDDRVRPQFREKNYSAGIVAGVYEILSTLDPGFVATMRGQNQDHVSRPGGSESHDGNSYLFWIILAFFILSSLFGRGRNRSGLLPFVLGYGAGRGSRGGWSGGGGSGWSGGGGGFSGGGASSDW